MAPASEGEADTGVETRECPICGDHRWRRVLTADGFAIVQCSSCRLARTEPSPAESDGREHFADDPTYYKRFYEEQRDLRYGFAAPLLWLLEEFAGTGRILDIGCGLGFFVDYARQHGYECVGIDTSRGAKQFAREVLHLRVITGDFMADAFDPRDPFDAIVMNHVLEHISAPIPFVRKVRRLLRPGGLVISASPNFGGLLSQVLACRWYGLQPSQHVWQFTADSYSALFQKAGFRVERTEISSMHYAPGSNWKETVIFCLAKLATIIGRGDNIVVVARVPEG